MSSIKPPSGHRSILPLVSPQKVNQRIYKEATNPQKPLYRVCMEIIHTCIPPERFLEPVSNWPKEIPKEWQTTLKDELSKKEDLKDIILDPRMLNEKTLNKILSFGYESFKESTSMCNPEALPLIAGQAAYDYNVIIRLNVERNPELDANDFAKCLHPFIVSSEIIREELIRQVDFLKFVCSYDQNLQFPIYNADYFLIFFLQFSKNFDEEYLVAIVHECMEKNADKTTFAVYRKLDQILVNGNVRLPDRLSSPLSAFIHQLFKVSSSIGESLFPTLFHILYDSIRHFQRDERDKRITLLYYDLWLNCKESIYGFISYLETLPGCEAIYQTLDSLSLLTPSSKAIDLLVKYYFHNKPPKASRTLSEKFYYSWWQGSYRRQKNLSIRESWVDLLMHRVLVDEGRWELSCEKAVLEVKILFRKLTPRFPFMPERAEDIYFLLQDLNQAQEQPAYEKTSPNKRRRL